MQLFEHYVLTVFNVNRGFDKTNKRNNPEYLKQRFKIFESITIPSVASQTNQNFFWFVFFDSNTPDEFKQRAQDILKLPNCLPVYVQGESEILSFLKERLSPKTEYLVTTNLDNDDAIDKKFIEIIQSNFRDEQLYFLNFTLGYMLRKEGLFMREFLSSPFHTVVEAVSDELLTCLSVPHYRLGDLSSKGVSVYQILTSPAWLQIVHDTNVSNRWDSNAIIVQNINKIRDFGINPGSPNFKKFYEGQLSKLEFCSDLINDKKKSYQNKAKIIIYTFFPSISLLKLRLKFLFKPIKKQKHSYSADEIRKLLSIT